jgi:hypothetical protein
VLALCPGRKTIKSISQKQKLLYYYLSITAQVMDICEDLQHWLTRSEELHLQTTAALNQQIGEFCLCQACLLFTCPINWKFRLLATEIFQRQKFQSLANEISKHFKAYATDKIYYIGVFGILQSLANGISQHFKVYDTNKIYYICVFGIIQLLANGISKHFIVV